jgi:uncharacterized protein (DUF2235 family)
LPDAKGRQKACSLEFIAGIGMKRFVVCLDGTWQQLQQKHVTNIGIIARSVAHTNTTAAGEEIPQIVIYNQGVGANTAALGKASLIGGTERAINKVAGGIFGEGLEDLIVDTYLRLAFNYEHGDEIYIFGFSRGAFAARSLAGLINCSGIVSRLHAEKAWDAFRLYRTALPDDPTEAQIRKHEEAQREFRRMFGKGARREDGTRVALDEPPPITYLGIFDTVGQRGMPDALGGLSRFLNRRYGFHNLRICPNVRAARHAVAIDERRLGFPPTLWEELEESNAEAQRRPGADPKRTYFEQRWFVGTHGDIGGGEDSPLSAVPLQWITEGAAACGLRFYATYGSDESPLDKALREAGLKFDAPIKSPSFWKSLSPMNYPIYSRRIWNQEQEPSAADAEALIDATVAMRAEAARVQPPYLPDGLRPFQGMLRAIAAQRLKPEELRP